jgi:hypothetical protein
MTSGFARPEQREGARDLTSLPGDRKRATRTATLRPRIVTCPGLDALGCSSAIDANQVGLCSRCRRRTALASGDGAAAVGKARQLQLALGTR